MTVVDNRDLRQASASGFPFRCYLWITVFSHMVHFLLALPILAVFLVRDGYQLNPSLAALPLIILVQFLFVTSLAYIVATLQVRFRDYSVSPRHPASFCSSYTDTGVLGRQRGTGALPFDHAHEPGGHDPWTVTAPVLMRGVWPDPIPLVGVAALSLVVLTLGCTAFNLARHRFVEDL